MLGTASRITSEQDNLVYLDVLDIDDVISIIDTDLIMLTQKYLRQRNEVNA